MFGRNIYLSWGSVIKWSPFKIHYSTPYIQPTKLIRWKLKGMNSVFLAIFPAKITLWIFLSFRRRRRSIFKFLQIPKSTTILNDESPNKFSPKWIRNQLDLPRSTTYFRSLPYPDESADEKYFTMRIFPIVKSIYQTISSVFPFCRFVVGVRN